MTALRDAFDRAIAAWNAGDLDRYLELYDDLTCRAFREGVKLAARKNIVDWLAIIVTHKSRVPHKGVDL